MRYQDCIFDLYGTLVDIHTDEKSPRLWMRMAEAYRRGGAVYHPGELRDAYFRLVGKLEGEADTTAGDVHEAHPEIQIGQIFQQLYREKGVDAEKSQIIRTALSFRKHSAEYLRLYPGAVELLRALRAKGCGVWLLSNAQSVFTRWELQRLGLHALFDGIYLSSDYGFKKPDPRFFRVLLQEQGIDPASSVMVGNDGQCDIGGAKALGLAAIYIRSNLSPKEPVPPADYALDSMDLRQVGAILGLASITDQQEAPVVCFAQKKTEIRMPGQ